jgi:hypothetical protein
MTFSNHFKKNHELSLNKPPCVETETLSFRAKETLPYPSMSVIIVNQSKTFEKLMLEQIREVQNIKTGRKKDLPRSKCYNFERGN